ncbi:RHS repeat-associated core domain-containing protein [Comamonas odontotermitis]|uniref:RHS repeat-associated core domain-containing protein n=1 Tax=Comamonas odontotermitis TaxID=379895 RepID=UPI00367048F7
MILNLIRIFNIKILFIFILLSVLFPTRINAENLIIKREPSYVYKLLAGPIGIPYNSPQDALSALQQYYRDHESSDGTQPHQTVFNVRPNNELGTVNGISYSWKWDYLIEYPSIPSQNYGGTTGSIEQEWYCPSGYIYGTVGWNRKSLSDEVNHISAWCELSIEQPASPPLACERDRYSYGKPINAFTRTESQSHLVYANNSPGNLSFSWNFESKSKHPFLKYFSSGQFGYWQHSFHYVLRSTIDDVYYFEGPGIPSAIFWKQNSNWNSSTPKFSISNDANYTYAHDNDAGIVYKFNSNGKVIEISNDADKPGYKYRLYYDENNLAYVEDRFGRRLFFGGYSGGKPGWIKTPDGVVVDFSYQNQSLSEIKFSSADYIHFFYEDARTPENLTGVSHSSLNKSSSYTYDEDGSAISTELAGGVNKYNFIYAQYDPDYAGMVTPTGVQVDFNFTRNNSSYVSSNVSKNFLVEGKPPIVSSQLESNGLKTKEQDFNGFSRNYTWGESRRLLISANEEIDSQESKNTSYVWDGRFRLPVKIQEPGRSNLYNYDPNGNLIEHKLVNGIVNQINRWSYNSKNLPVTHTDENGQITSYTYDSNGNLASVTEPSGKTTSYTNDASGRILTSTSPSGVVSSYAYDYRGRLTSAKQGGLETKFFYSLKNALQSVQYPSGYVITYSYDDANRLIGWSDNRSNKQTYVLDSVGNRVTELLQNGQGEIAFKLQREINSLNNLEKETYGDTQIASYVNDGNGNVSAAGVGSGARTNFLRDGLGRITQITDPLNNAATITYNQLDSVTAAKDFKGVTTSYTRDALGNAKQEVTPDAGTGAATYDVRGLLASTTDATGRTIGVERDALGRITKINYNNGTSSVLRYDLTGTTYNTAAAPNASIGHLSEVQDPGVTTQYQRDALGRVLRKTQILAGGATKSIAYTYVPAGQGGAGSVKSITYPSGKQLTYQYSSTGLITGMQWNGTALLSGLTWNPLGMPKGWSWPGILAAPGATAKLAEARSYNTAGQLTHTGIIDLTWDAAGRVSAIEQSQMVAAAASAGGAPTTTVQARIASAYTYDAAGRMTASGHSLQGAPVINWPQVGTLATGFLDVAGYTSMGYAYDANGNRLSASIVKTPPSGNTATISQTYSITDGSNRLVSVAGTTDTTGAASTKTYQYDAAGAITSATTTGTTSGAQYLHYGANGRVAKVTGTASSTDPSAVSYLYNSASQRLLKTDARQSTTAPRTEHTLYSEEDSAQLLGTYSNQRSASSAAPAGEMDSTEVIYLPTAQGMVPVATQINGRLYAIHADHLNTPRRLTNAQGQVAWQWLLTGFGEVSPTTGAKGYVQADSAVAGSLPSYAPEVTFNLRYPGQQWDEETEMAYNMHRYYVPPLGRYIQADPIGLDGGWNRFGYVDGNPLNSIDPQGLANSSMVRYMPLQPKDWIKPGPVKICHRPINISWIPGIIGGALPHHHWVKTPTAEAGMGGACPVPGQQCSDKPYSDTVVKNHLGESNQPGAQCEDVGDDVDVECVERLIKVGNPTGTWTAWNQCMTFSYEVIMQCRRRK